MGDQVLLERDGPRAEVVLNRPERKNAVVQPMAEELAVAFAAAGSDPEVRAVVLRGAGGSFCSGIDLKVAGSDLRAEPITAWAAVHAARYRCRPPVVVAVERFAINAGAALALSGDLVVMGESAFLQVSEMAMGVAAPMCQAWLHLRGHSPAVADRLTFLADRVPAAEALHLGLVTEVVADGEVVPRARELADRIAGYPPAGPAGVAAVWRRLRGELDDPEAWFAALTERAR
ncbi:MAG: enoyl-CoA hydratase/isomerase family protein [Acidimicrobiaceae bacterium]|nr:enoyl-CoA hydratase/isomerase family protein [Ilumatobacter sp.]MCB9379704.1 enoyl-CoA hydratase/isomerase family protein [Acidimicrobiaceae bacterium]MCO5329116.1 enoyl-CoA hydratase/isomerase family protein [Ilumatobacteraceae bacterium]